MRFPVKTLLQTNGRMQAWAMAAALLLGFISTAAAAQTSTTPALSRYEASHRAMGTVYTIAAYGSDQVYVSEVVRQAFEVVDRLDQQMSNYKPDSELSAINRDAGHEEVLVEPRLFGLLQDSLRFSQETDGAFDVTVGPLMKAWGFFRGRGRLPSPQEIHTLLGSIGYQHVQLDAARRTIRFDKPATEIDLGGIAKGYAVDRVVRLLREDHISAALVSAGASSIYALGAPPGENAWHIHLRDPFDATKSADVIDLKNYSLSTSGDYVKFFVLGGKMYSHIMNPHTGMPVENMLSTAVAAASTTDSDALSTAYYVMGVDASRRYAGSHPNLAALFYVPGGQPKTFRRVSVRSASFALPGTALVEIR